jgi:hypothetical protein
MERDDHARQPQYKVQYGGSHASRKDKIDKDQNLGKNQQAEKKSPSQQLAKPFLPLFRLHEHNRPFAFLYPKLYHPPRKNQLLTKNVNENFNIF